MFSEGLDPAKHGINYPTPSPGPVACLSVFLKLFKKVRSGFYLFETAKNTDPEEVCVFIKVEWEDNSSVAGHRTQAQT